jgi:hypothetical protein
VGTTSDVASTVVSNDWISASGASGATITDNIISVSNSMDYLNNRLGYNHTYYWWVKVKNNNGIESTDWAPGGSFTTPQHHYPTVKIVPTNTKPVVGETTRICSSAVNSSDPCYATCGSTTPGNPGWLCSVCYDSSNNPINCAGPGNTFSWTLPATVTFASGSTAASANPEVIFDTNTSNLALKLDITGSTCGEDETIMETQLPLPKWQELSPY